MHAIFDSILRTEGYGMRETLRALTIFFVMVLLGAMGLTSVSAQARTVTCVGLYSETAAGHVSYRVGSGDWTVVAVGDKIPVTADIRVNVDRDWVEVIQTGVPTKVYEVHGPDTGEVVKKVSDLLKGKGKVVSFPKGTKTNPDPKFKNKLVVGTYLGRQVYETPDGDENDIRYGDVLDRKGKVRIIAINNTIELTDATGKVTKVIGPLTFDVEKVLTGQKLYKYLNAP